MSAIVGERAAQRTQVGGPAARGGEELHHARTGCRRGEDLGRREDAGHGLEAELSAVSITSGTRPGLTTKRAPAAAAARTCSESTMVPTPTVLPSPAAHRDRLESTGRVDCHLDLLDPAADERGHCPRDVSALVEAHDSDQRTGAEHVLLEHRPTLSRAML